jgi:hypothetical protein
VPLPASQDPPPKSSLLLALVPSIVADHDRSWLAAPVAQLIPDGYDAIGIEHAPQREATPTEKATVERGFGTVKNALAPILDLLNRIAGAVPDLRQPVLARHVATLLVATFLRVYAAGRRHLGHPLDGQDPDVLCAIVEQQRAMARAEDRPCGCSSKPSTASRTFARLRAVSSRAAATEVQGRARAGGTLDAYSAFGTTTSSCDCHAIRYRRPTRPRAAKTSRDDHPRRAANRMNLNVQSE